MRAVKPTKRRVLIRNLKKLGFDGPYAGGNHQYMMKGKRKLWLPNPHSKDLSASFLRKILKQAGISQQEWEQL